MYDGSAYLRGGVPHFLFNFFSLPMCLNTVERPKSEIFNTSVRMGKRAGREGEEGDGREESMGTMEGRMGGDGNHGKQQ